MRANPQILARHEIVDVTIVLTAIVALNSERAILYR